MARPPLFLQLTVIISDRDHDDTQWHSDINAEEMEFLIWDRTTQRVAHGNNAAVKDSSTAILECTEGCVRMNPIGDIHQEKLQGKDAASLHTFTFFFAF